MKILGYDWEDIQRAQQGGSLSRPVAPSGRPPATDKDRELLQQYGSISALRDAGFHGAVDRLEGEL